MNIVEKQKIELQNIREQQITSLLSKIYESADGENVVGDGTRLIHETDSLKITHEFSDGIYIRRMDFNKDCFVVGAIHKEKHTWFLLVGRITVATNEHGSQEFIAPCYITANPGVQRLIYAQEDSIFINVYPNPDNKQNIDDIEKRIYCLNREEYNKYKTK